MTEDQNAEIDAMSYEEMLRLWRFAPAGHATFQGERGEYFDRVMTRKKNADPDAAVRASKVVGWD